MLAPSTELEDDRLGDFSAKVKETAAETTHEAIERGKEVAQSAVEVVREEGTEQTRGLAQELTERVHPADSSTAAPGSQRSV